MDEPFADEVAKNAARATVEDADHDGSPHGAVGGMGVHGVHIVYAFLIARVVHIFHAVHIMHGTHVVSCVRDCTRFHITMIVRLIRAWVTGGLCSRVRVLEMGLFGPCRPPILEVEV